MFTKKMDKFLVCNLILGILVYSIMSSLYAQAKSNPNITFPIPSPMNMGINGVSNPDTYQIDPYNQAIGSLISNPQEVRPNHVNAVKTNSALADSARYFDGEDWQDIDTTLREDSTDSDYTYSMLTNNFKVKLNKVGNPSLSFSVYDQSVVYRAEETNMVTGMVDGNSVVYPRLWNETDLYYHIENNQLKMELHLLDHNAPKTFKFELQTKNVNHHLNEDGSIDFVDSLGQVNFKIPPLWIKDTSSGEKRYDRIQTTITEDNNRTILEITLNDEGLQYPIVIDPTTELIDYHEGTGFQPWNWNSGVKMLDDNSSVWFKDVNGDGKADMIAKGQPGSTHAGWIFVSLSTVEGFQWWTWDSGGRMLDDNGQIWFEDVNGDGKVDMITQGQPGQPNAGWVYVSLSTGTGFQGWTWSSGVRMLDDNSSVWFKDVNGDGKVDLISRGLPGHENAGWVYVAMSNGTGFPDWTWSSGGRMLDDNGQFWFEDVNGDGKVDMIAQGQPGQYNAGWLYVSLSTGSGFQGWTWNSGARMLDDNSSVWFKDVNGDGKVDMISRGLPGSGNAGWLYVSISTGQGFPWWTWNSGSKMLNDKDSVWFEDMNGDGKSDMIARIHSGGNHEEWIYVSLSTGVGYQPWTWKSGNRMFNYKDSVWLSDVNGDGKTDLIVTGQSGDSKAGWVFVSLSSEIVTVPPSLPYILNTGFPSSTWNSGVKMLDDNNSVWFKDVNGDGKADMIARGLPGSENAGWVYVSLSTGEGFQWWTWDSGGRMLDDNGQIWFEDVNGDGKVDMITQGQPGQPNAGWVYVSLSTGTGFQGWTWSSGVRMLDDNSSVWFKDVNGDGKVDLISRGLPGHENAGWVYVAMSNGTGYPDWTWSSGGRVLDDKGQFWFEDVNGDGKVDMIAQGQPGQYNAGWVYVSLSTGTGFQGWTWNSGVRMLDDNSIAWFKDVNGDGKVDMISRGLPGSGNAGWLYVSISTGEGFPWWTWNSGSKMLNDKDSVWFEDMNGDGKSDLIKIGQSGGSNAGWVYSSLSNGEGFPIWTWDSKGKKLDDNGLFGFGDINGDGRADLISTGQAGSYNAGWVYISLSAEVVIPNYFYDIDGHLIQILLPSGESFQLQYDANGNLVKRIKLD
ncbi:FG-GAP-like repeat-containing protein [Paenibacillus sp. WQ 127069]|uniref:FG-GAP-like repeat-containing protein n=1 Tax=Paenibacillus baimaensis TaxID=2982185 RepID=A0ABT2UFG2_9BACL|nr:FG-GAP-like repeat-containing protein [Paenibacillus sp. WQ 127069]MCU6793379.1 FG-GAP-like repeat-containing protein [Paenibacillus sp. WQ 127069]